MKPKCPTCDEELKFEAPYWHCDSCDEEWLPEDLEEEQEDEES